MQKLNPERTGTTCEAVRVMSNVSFEGIGLFEHEGYWYLVSGHTCPNCPSTTVLPDVARAAWSVDEWRGRSDEPAAADATVGRRMYGAG